MRKVVLCPPLLAARHVVLVDVHGIDVLFSFHFDRRRGPIGTLRSPDVDFRVFSAGKENVALDYASASMSPPQVMTFHRLHLHPTKQHELHRHGQWSKNVAESMAYWRQQTLAL